MNKILILGPQGSGKGTQAVRLSQKLGIPALSMGQLLRNEITSGSDLGKEIDSIINKGELVSDKMALEILKKRLQDDDAQKGYILDGYPRNKAQYDAYKTFDTPTAVLLIDVPHGESMRRLLKRAETEKRADDAPDLIARRLEIYAEDTRPILDLYDAENLVKKIDGIGEMEEVEVRIDDALGI